MKNYNTMLANVHYIAELEGFSHDNKAIANATKKLSDKYLATEITIVDVYGTKNDISIVVSINDEIELFKGVC